METGALPVALINKRRVLDNICRMQERARCSGASFRPHFKTHQSLEIGEWFRDLDIQSITVSSPAMAQFFMANGWDDCLIALPMHAGAVPVYNELAPSRNLELLTDSVVAVQAVDQALQQRVGLWIEVDAGYQRTGVPFHNLPALIELACVIEESTHFELRGLLIHAGQSYSCKGKEALADLFADQMRRLNTMRTALVEAGFDNVRISYGDTPCCSGLDSLTGVDELRPGNFVFYDLMQENIGACEEADIALAVSCPVIGVYPERSQVLIHGGAVHFSKESLTYDSGLTIFGKVVENQLNGWGNPLSGCYLRGMSQEHGVIEGTEDWVKQQKVGGVVTILPVHSCLTMNLLRPDFIEVG